MTLRDLQGGANVGMLFFNPTMLTEKYNAPDTLKCQHTFKLSKGNCLYSDMGRIFCSVVDDSFGWHESVCGNSHATLVEERWGKRDYQKDSNAWHQNGYDAFLVELTKYNLSARDMASNINWFSCVRADDKGNLILANQSKAGDEVVLRFEMDTLVLLHTCPHPLNISTAYPEKPVDILLEKAAPIENDDFCKNFRPENQRGFENNALYHFGMESQ
ncbi:urea carboxylase-associated family protein [Aurantivibrio plasticivorans]